jgi:hypothetical protein
MLDYRVFFCNLLNPKNSKMTKLRIAIINIHGLLKGSGLEIGRDADNGGQTKYVFELAEFIYTPG